MKYIFLLLIFISCALHAQKPLYNYTQHVSHFNSNSFQLNLTTLGDSGINIIPDTSHIWQVGHAKKAFFDSTFSIVTDTVGPYPLNKTAYFDIVIPAKHNKALGNFDFLTLSFTHKYQCDSPGSAAYILTSYNNGNTWVNICHDDTTRFIYTQNFYFSKGVRNDTAFSGVAGNWITSSISWDWVPPGELPFYNYNPQSYRTSNPDSFIIRFVFKSDTLQKHLGGWCIKNIILEGAYFFPGSISNINLSDFKITPNPFQNLIQVALNKDCLTGHENMIVFNMDGLPVYTRKLTCTPLSINTDSWPKGSYFAGIYRHGQIIASRKLIKQ